MTDTNHTNRYEDWLTGPPGAYAFEQCQNLLRSLFSGWPRRTRSVLVMNAGSGAYLDTVWEAGFDVTAHDSEPAYLAKARERLGQRAEFVLSVPDHLPFDDCSFDYAVVAAALEFWEDPQAVLEEVNRLVCAGVILIFPNAWSLFGLECRLRPEAPLCATAGPLLQSPRRIMQLAQQSFGSKKMAWASVLPAFSATWSRQGLYRFLNAGQAPFPLGAFVGLRIDFGPEYSGTPLLLKATDAVTTGK